MKIRSMRTHDLLNASKVHREAFPRQLHSEEWITSNFNAYPRIRLFVAEEDETILGYVQWIEKSGFRKEVVLELEQIAVLPSQQKHGIGSLLISESLILIKEELNQRDAIIKRVLVSTRTDNEAQKLYKKVLNAQPEVVISNLFSGDEVLMIARNPFLNAAHNFPTTNELEALMREKKVPGLSYVIIENAEITAHKELGLKNTQEKDLIDENTIFEAASLSKPVFTYGILKLVENGRLDLDKPLSEYLRYPDIANDERSISITARMVLMHTAGFPNWRPKDESLKIHFQPGERFSYSGEGFLYLQKVVEHISGLSLEEYLQKNVFIPLEMSKSSFNWSNDSKKATGHNADGNPLENQREVPQNAAFTMHTTPLDYAKFVIATLKGVGLNSKTMNEMLRPQIQVQEGSTNSIENYTGKLSNSVSWSLGWGIQHTKMGDSFWHWGDNGGFHSFILGSKSRNNAILIFTNSSNGLILISEITRKYIGVPQPALDWLEMEYS
jgi:CubicO group peptidase (beta-lactamase class C family)/GNAT superfamily N-acetyltransferase